MNRAALLVSILLFSCKGVSGEAESSEPPPSGVSPEQHNKDEALRAGLAPTCASCHGAGTNKPFFASARAFADLLVYNTQYVVPGNPDGSELVRLLEARGTTYKQMPLGSKTYAESSPKLSIAEVREFIRTMEGRKAVDATPDPAAPLMRRLSATQIEQALYSQLGLTRADFFDPESNLARHPDLLPIRNPDQAIAQTENYVHSYSRQRWVGLGGANHFSLVSPKNDPSPTFAQNINQIAQGWCRVAVEKPGSVLLREAADVRRNVDYLYLRMLGLAPTAAETDKLVALFTHYQAAGDDKLGWTSVCAALVRHPLWLSY